MAVTSVCSRLLIIDEMGHLPFGRYQANLFLSVPALGYYPPEVLVRALSPSIFVRANVEKIVMVVYILATVALLFLFFIAVQERLPGKRGLKGLVFGSLLGVLWSIAFLVSIVFLGSSVKAQVLNGLVDLCPLALAGWLAGRIHGTERVSATAATASHAMFFNILYADIWIELFGLTIIDIAGVLVGILIYEHTAARRLKSA